MQRTTTQPSPFNGHDPHEPLLRGSPWLSSATSSGIERPGLRGTGFVSHAAARLPDERYEAVKEAPSTDFN